jgi:hypothetical protein
MKLRAPSVEMLVMFFLLGLLTGCAGHAVQTAAVLDVQDFPRPAPLKNDAFILLQITAQDGQLYFVSLDQPDWHDIRVGAHDVTMDAGTNVVLHADQLEWNLGASTVTLKDSAVLLTQHSVEGKASTIRFTAVKNLIRVARDGIPEETVTDGIVKIDANSGRVIFY